MVEFLMLFLLIFAFVRMLVSNGGVSDALFPHFLITRMLVTSSGVPGALFTVCFICKNVCKEQWGFLSSFFLSCFPFVRMIVGFWILFLLIFLFMLETNSEVPDAPFTYFFHL